MLLNTLSDDRDETTARRYNDKRWHVIRIETAQSDERTDACADWSWFDGWRTFMGVQRFFVCCVNESEIAASLPELFEFALQYWAEVFHAMGQSLEHSERNSGGSE